MVDGKEGITAGDKKIAQLLHKSGKAVVLAVNKIDNPKEEVNKVDFYELGFGEPVTLSAMHGDGGVGDLLDHIMMLFDKSELELDSPSILDSVDATRKNYGVAIVGKPNVGKSSIVNSICGSQRSIVTSMPGTTRDAVDTSIQFKDRVIALVDTAGIRRRSKVDYGVEAFSVVRSINAINRADVVVLVLDATSPVSDQDQKIATMIEEAGKAAVIVLNKWDLVEDRSSRAMNQMTSEIYLQLRQIAHAKILFTSATTGQRVMKILEATQEAFEQSQKQISTSMLNKIMHEAMTLTPPPASKRGKRLRAYYSTQTGVLPPTFLLFVNDGELLNQSYKAYLERKLREAFGFDGACLRLLTRNKEKK
jgi:GTP-binding protein